jgi:hypothetical protein
MSMALLLTVLLLVLSAPLAAQPYRAAADDSALVKRVRGAAHGLSQAWRKEWMRGYREKTNGLSRDAAGHCHFDGSYYASPPNLIPSGTRKSMCPTWYPLPEVKSDEQLGIDAALREEGRAKIRARRAAVLVLIDSALSAMPDNAMLHGQRVRYAVDQRDSVMARDAVAECQGRDGWCGLLGVYVAAKFGALTAADSLLDAALTEVESAQRCAWTDIAPLLDAPERKTYEKRACAERLRLEKTYWWLADPFWSQPRNERRAEHFSRLVEIVLRSEFETDERFDWRRDKGGTAFSHLVVRYGWPSFIGWLGHHEDGGHRGWLAFDDGAVATLAPEYTAPRSHVTPPWRAVTNTASLERDDWQEMSPRWKRNQWDTRWWAQEHMRFGDAPITPLPDQTALFRRARNAIVAVATQMTVATGKTEDGAPYSASLVVASEPEVSVVVDRPLRAGDRVAIVAPVVNPSLLSIELLPQRSAGGPGGPAAMGRSRYAVTPPPGLHKLAGGTIALSDLALFHATTDEARPSTVDELLGVMLPTSTVARGARLGVFWEAYGMRAGDTADVKIRVERDDRSLLRGLAARAGLASDEKPAVEISWREPQAGLTGYSFLEAGTPVQTRAVTLGLAALEPGRYTVTLSVTPVRAPAATSVRSLEIR